ncbi:Zn-dependent exopeptidase M28 [Methanoculleus sp. FWC-SCC1]|uniref:Zn-dependent exopeptidase M28 n=2 Tax=Methanoculleus frigidifontis TaxID=2584085 RepID=A0ABT8MDP8_9EURY|nr:Zn-dependent exopeptidase M28 [Methanoculleus sp. FWC-SCC1]
MQEEGSAANLSSAGQEVNPRIAGMITEVSESELSATTADLQAFGTRVVRTDGNAEAAAYLHDRLRAVPGLAVEYQGGDLRNVVATLPGSGPGADTFVVVGAHYDSTSSDPENAPGATDNAAGVAIVLELARIMSNQTFDRTVQFALWNAEETDRSGSRDYARQAAADDREILFYFNYDSACLDPEGRSMLDIMYDERSAPVADLMHRHNTLYGINLTLTENNYTCISDHVPFREAGYPAVMTHQEGHGSGHTPDDTVDHMSLPFTRKNAQLGMSVIAEVAGVQENGTGTPESVRQ